MVRTFAGDFESGRMQDQAVGQGMWLVAVGVMLPYEGLYDHVLIAVGFVGTGLIIWQARCWDG